MSIGKVEYRVRRVERFIVTRYVEDTEGRPCGSEQKGEYDSAPLAYDVGYALARDERQRLGWPPGDLRMTFPDHVPGNGTFPA